MSEEDYKEYEERVNRDAESNPEPEEDFEDDDDSYEQMDEADEGEFSLDDLPGDDEVLKLTEYDGNLQTNSGVSVVAEYHDINIAEIDQKHALSAKNFVTKVTKFVLDFKDLDLTDAHKAYVKEVAKLELNNLTDMMGLVTVNKQMLDNIVRRVNSTQAEDYAMIGTYNNLVNLQLRLSKELQNAYRSLPGTLKKMRAEIICNQELPEKSQGSGEDGAEPITEAYGTTQFNNTKHLLKTLREKNEKKNAANDAA
jgi:hypothetical protein